MLEVSKKRWNKGGMADVLTLFADFEQVFIHCADYQFKHCFNSLQMLPKVSTICLVCKNILKEK